MKKEMLINVLQPEECRIAIVEDGVLEELYVERASQESYVGNIYKGRIVNIEPSIQAAFVDFGIGRNGFLHVSDVDPAYFKHLLPKDVLERFESGEDEEDGPPRRPQGRSDRNDRNDRGGRGRGRQERERSPRIESPVPRTSRGTFPDVEDEDDGGFAAGLVEEAPADNGEPLEAEYVEVIEEVIEEEGDGAFGNFDDEPVAEAPKPAPPPAPAPVRATPPPAPPADDDDFGFGVGLDLDDAPAQWSEPPRQVEVTEVVTVTEAPEVADAEIVAEEAEKPEEPKKPRAAARKPRAKKEAPAEGEEAEAKPKRRTRKKADTEDKTDEPPSDPEPKVMGGPERRTTEDDPEIQPFFDDGGDFDPNAPNDRFAEGESTGEVEGEFVEEEVVEGEEVEEVPVGPSGEEEPFDEDEFAPPIRREDDRRGGNRGRGGDRGRGGPRGGDRGGPPRGGPRRNDRPGGPQGGPRPGGGRDRNFPRMPIEKIFKRGQEVIVQVIKEGIGTKGPTLSTFVSIAGRYLVLMPSLNRVGVSRKIEDRDARHRLRDIMTKLNPPKGVGFIVRTAATDRNETELQNDLAYLLRLWQVVVRRIKRVAGPVEIYRESDMITRTIRDIFTNDIDTIWVDEEHAFAHASEFLQIVMPKFASRIRYFSDTEPLFHKYGVENEIAKINQKRLDMPEGGSIILEQTEALVAIDVNSGTFRAENNAEETAFQMNLRAAKEIARQLRLRDLGGVIVNDFIDMRSESHRRRVEDTLRDALKRDRARTKILRISQFGIIEMTRQRIQPSLKKRIFNDCSHCKGTGYVKNQETMGIEVMRLLQLAAHRTPVIASIAVTVHQDAAYYLLNRKRKEITALEEKAKMEVQVMGVPGVSPDLCEVKCLDANGNEVRLFGGPPPRALPSAGRGPRQFNDRGGGGGGGGRGGWGGHPCPDDRRFHFTDESCSPLALRVAALPVSGTSEASSRLSLSTCGGSDILTSPISK